ncbi:hypothetical protein BEWA_020620 [Theileria equi strain WA]|uniref:Uncharacterized protein n=1 Tax=Theileria equi strain WA TaxID=1537102 RepID=L0AUI0_THEEQ|nr:hypothetical protein BEWA_020620 [Theileria equi strain WA]AFZ79215.1 hypothetical protein BEWA_020620 [Theileria equi strain WA]|eukprot:XP_004828881.1 hypothetical protein BEWA_020620 [Theileria equi strain WA]
MTTHTCTTGLSADIDIGQRKSGGSYEDSCQNTINIRKVDNRPTAGYKRYTHTLTGGNSVAGIYYNKEKQNGIDLSGGEYKKNVTIYYLDYDATNALPLIVGLERTYSDNYYYYKKTDYLTSDRWKDEYGVNKESELSSKLTSITSQLKLKQLVVLNTSQTQGSYFANGENNAPPANLTTQIQVTESSTEHQIYKKYKHTPSPGISVMRLLYTKDANNNNIPFESPVYRTSCSEAYVYYWNGATRSSNPLLLELKSNPSSTYYTVHKTGRTDNKWRLESSIETSNIKDKLDEQNCTRNNAHIMDISKASKSGYTCPCCKSKQIGLSIHGEKYFYYYHNIYGGFFSRLKNGGTEQTGIKFPKGTTRVYVYHYPKGSEGIPLLIHFLNKWYQRESLESSSWNDVKVDPPTSPFKKDKILKLLEAKLPAVAVNVWEGNDLKTGGQHSEYDDPSGSKQIKVTRDDVESEEEGTGYTSFTHCVQGKPNFIVKEVKYGSSSLQGIDPSSILKTVTAYYSGRSEFKLDNLLMIELVKRNGPNNYAYYSRKNGGSTWRVDREQANKLGNSELTQKLKNLKEELDKPSSPSGLQGLNGAGGPQAPDRGEKNIFQKALNFIESHPAEIGGVGGTIGTGILGFGTWKLWPKIMSCLITKTL